MIGCPNIHHKILARNSDMRECPGAAGASNVAAATIKNPQVAGERESDGWEHDATELR